MQSTSHFTLPIGYARAPRYNTQVNKSTNTIYHGASPNKALRLP
jgi:hypothetical protein